MENLVIIRGGGDLATGTAYKLYQCGFRVLILEVSAPAAIRRNVAFCEAVWQGEQTVEGVTCFCAGSETEAVRLLEEGKLTLLVDPKGACIRRLEPMAVVDAILAKKNLGTRKDMAGITVALGPGFEADRDVDAVIETMRGHNLGRVIYHGEAMRNTGIPGKIGGYDRERVIYSPAAGIVRNRKQITDSVQAGDVIAEIETEAGSVPVKTGISGLLRGLIRDGYRVPEGFKMADVDPRIEEYENCFTISDKARCIAGGVLEAILHLRENG